MELNQARLSAEDWVRFFRPTCERIEIAGSIRRGKPEVHDIEICAVPIMSVIDPLEMIVQTFAQAKEFILLKNGPKYKQLALPNGVNIDLFIVIPPAEWGVLFLIRTGPADFSRWIVTPRKYGGALPSDCKVSQGAVWRNHKKIPMPEESDFFKLLNMSYILPEDRERMVPK